MDDRKYVEAFALDLVKRRADFHKKVADVRQVLQDAQLDAIVLSYTHNFSWFTGGARNFINMAAVDGVGSIYVDASQVVVLTNEIEGHRLINEEMDGLQADVKLHEDPWYAQPQAIEVARKLANSDKIGVDMLHADVEARISKLREVLTEYEMDIYRSLGADCGKIIGEVARSVRPSQTEWEITAELSALCWKKSITPIVALVAADERVDAIRHPLPTNKRVKNKVMIVLCGRRAGFVLSVTRMVYVTTTPGAKIPEDLLRRHEAATYVDAVAITSSKPGVAAKDIFKAIQDAYETKGFPGEWKLHHQGGCAGYKSREWIANPQHTSVVSHNNGFAWNPSVTGTKTEDTVLMRDGPNGSIVYEVISETPEWPLIEHEVNGVKIKRPGILHIAY
ncbi:hypothetical protein Poli38472_008127 [Pythium oligandrum]|uniref:Peptidase M24 domain-containing protein n=1 Tax=Pythium oligandrum TaxID=41045 RepID=A0A8K1CLK2_PYTOL|nr:hypothetical protein Poli38472_008127 [Pythium oligandrum]|eukprot:TMW65485.1 hypothetical protein Poli38472_008127 [Pythium oligandrum]